MLLFQVFERQVHSKRPKSPASHNSWTSVCKWIRDDPSFCKLIDSGTDVCSKNIQTYEHQHQQWRLYDELVHQNRCSIWRWSMDRQPLKPVMAYWCINQSPVDGIWENISPIDFWEYGLFSFISPSPLICRCRKIGTQCRPERRYYCRCDHFCLQWMSIQNSVVGTQPFWWRRYAVSRPGTDATSVFVTHADVQSTSVSLRHPIALVGAVASIEWRRSYVLVRL